MLKGVLIFLLLLLMLNSIFDTIIEPITNCENKENQIYKTSAKSKVLKDKVNLLEIELRGIIKNQDMNLRDININENNIKTYNL